MRIVLSIFHRALTAINRSVLLLLTSTRDGFRRTLWRRNVAKKKIKKKLSFRCPYSRHRGLVVRVVTVKTVVSKRFRVRKLTRRNRLPRIVTTNVSAAVAAGREFPKRFRRETRGRETVSIENWIIRFYCARRDGNATITIHLVVECSQSSFRFGVSYLPT